MSRISIVTIFYNITRMDRRKKIDNFSQQFQQPISTYVYIAYIVVILVTAPTQFNDFSAHKIS